MNHPTSRLLSIPEPPCQAISHCRSNLLDIVPTLTYPRLGDKGRERATQSPPAAMIQEALHPSAGPIYC
jgi:hypothetical protein